MSIIYTVPGIYYQEFVITPATFSAAPQSVELAPFPAFRSNDRILDIVAYKEIAFDGGASIALGHSTVTAGQQTMATFSEISAGAVGVVKPVAWLDPTTGYGQLMPTTAGMRLFARLSTALPTVGLLRVIITMLYMPPRTTAL